MTTKNSSVPVSVKLRAVGSTKEFDDLLEVCDGASKLRGFMGLFTLEQLLKNVEAVRIGSKLNSFMPLLIFQLLVMVMFRLLKTLLLC